MTDTPAEFEAMVEERFRRMTPDERVRIAAAAHLRDPEIEDLHDRPALRHLREEHVRRLEIAMHDACRVRLRERGAHLDRDVHGLEDR